MGGEICAHWMGVAPLIMADETNNIMELYKNAFSICNPQIILMQQGLVRKSSTFWKATVWDCKRTCLVKHMSIRGICHDWQTFWSEVLNISEQCGATPSATKKPKTKPKNPLALNLVNIVYWLTIGQKESDRDENSFRTTFFFPMRDKMLCAINRKHIFNFQWS